MALIGPSASSQPSPSVRFGCFLQLGAWLGQTAPPSPPQADRTARNQIPDYIRVEPYMIVPEGKLELRWDFRGLTRQLASPSQQLEAPIPRVFHLRCDMPWYIQWEFKKLPKWRCEKVKRTTVAASKLASAFARAVLSLYKEFSFSKQFKGWLFQTNLSVRLRFFLICSTSLRNLS